MTTREWDPASISLAPSFARTVNSIWRPSIFITSASPVTRRPNRRRGEMAHVDRRADSTLAGIEIGSDRIEGGVLHDHDHDGSGEHRRQDRVLEPVRKMLGQDEKAEGAFGSKGYPPHGLPSKGRGDDSKQCSNPTKTANSMIRRFTKAPIPDPARNPRQTTEVYRAASPTLAASDSPACGHQPSTHR
jgi:hypothetical protein